MNNTGNTNTSRQIIYTKLFKIDSSDTSGNSTDLVLHNSEEKDVWVING